MKVTVRFFARARDLAGTSSASFDLPDGATVQDLRRRLAADYPALEVLLARSAVAVDDEFAGDNQRLEGDAEVALLPPVSGG
ncbi:MAG: molybdopterin converting factor subunit 1 [Planctomycetes bacterium]|nr:molybdopterin converting factor subunit 1 [Planctomycetota bacterium]